MRSLLVALFLSLAFVNVFSAYWFLDTNSDFDQNSYPNYPALHDFNLARASRSGSLVLNGELDWNSETVGQIVSDQNLAAYIDFDDENSTHVMDKSANGNDFNKTNGADSNIIGILGTNGGVLDATDSYFGLAMGSSNKLNFRTGSWGLWAKSNTNNYASQVQLIDRRNANASTVALQVPSDDVPECQVMLDGSEGTARVINANGAIDQNFHHYFCTYDGSTLKMFVDGVQQTETLDVSGTIDIDSAATMTIGALDTGGQVFNGHVDEARFYGRVLTASDINVLYYQSVIDSSLVLYWKFNDDNGTHVQDISRFNHDAIFVNSSSGDTNRPGLFDSNAAYAGNQAAAYVFPTDDLNFGAGSFSVGTWARISSTNRTGGAGPAVFAKGNTGSSSRYWYFSFAGDQTPRCTISNGGPSYQTQSAVDFNARGDNKWHQYFCIIDKDANLLRLYVDGSQRSSATIANSAIFDYNYVSGITNNVHALAINSSGTQADLGLNGQYDEFKVYRRLLSAVEIQADYNRWWNAQYFSRVFDGVSEGVCSDCNFSQVKVNVPSDMNTVVAGVRLFGRVCTDSTCSTGPAWISDLNFVYGSFVNLNAGAGHRGRYFQLRADMDFNNALNHKYVQDFNTSFPSINDLNVYVVRVTPMDINVTRIEGTVDTGPLPVYSYIQDGNLTIDFNVLNVDFNNLILDLNYSSTTTEGTGTVIVNDLNLSRLGASGAFNCMDTNFQNSTQCSVDWNIIGVGDGNYYLNVSVSDGSSTDFNSSDLNVLVDNTGPVLSISSPAEGATITVNTVTLEYSGTDNNTGIATYWVSDDGSTWINNSTNTSYDFTNQANGAHTYYVIATDGVDNNSSTGSVSVTVSVSTSGNQPPGGGGGGSSGIYCKSYYRNANICKPTDMCMGEWARAAIDTKYCCVGICKPLEEEPGEGEPFLERVFSVEKVFQSFIEAELPVLVEPVSEGNVVKRVALKGEAVATRILDVDRVLKNDGIAEYKSTFTLSVENVSGRDLGGVEFLESIPKEIVENASLIDSSVEFVVVKEDPVLRFSIGSLKQGEEKSLEYWFVSQKNSATEELFLGMPAPLVLLELTQEDACSGVFCNDFNPCTNDYCASGQCTYTPLSNGAACGERMSCEQGECVEVITIEKTTDLVTLPAQQGGKTNPLMLITALVFGTALIILGYLKYKNKKKNRL